MLGVDPLGLADEAEVDLDPRAALDPAADELLARISPPSLPDSPTAQPPAALIAATSCFVDRAGQHHLDDLHGLARR